MLRTKVEEKHKEWYEAVQKVADDAGIELKAPRACGRSVHRANPTVPGASAEDHFRITITTPLLDCLLQELHARFSDAQSAAASGLVAVPAVMKKTTDWKASLKRFIDQYSEDMPAPSSITSELDNWWVKWSRVGEDSLPSTVQAALQQCCKHTFPNIFATLAILAVMPITSCECERSVSALRLLKTYLRSTMGQSRLTGLALLHIRYDLAVDVTDIVDMFALKHPRKMRMTNILQDAE
ncbi:52 kDa repressor of the inhibitor of the protein kinase-like [Sycon ciliatum]|uniref:52 kDa repressor of the inhibitor of the protein kinase-like n=1 Tax=Sycon ciliatum TaxID=27933 RepID=UPI0031F6D5E9